MSFLSVGEVVNRNLYGLLLTMRTEYVRQVASCQVEVVGGKVVGVKLGVPVGTAVEGVKLSSELPAVINAAESCCGL